MANEIMGIAFVIIGFGVLYLLYQLGRFYKTMSDLEERYALFEISLINKKAGEFDIDLDKEKMKLRTLETLPKTKSFKGHLKKEIWLSFFGKDQQEK